MASANATNSDLFTHAESSAAPLVQSDIQAMAVEHAHWLSSEGREGKRANFRGLDLRACRFTDMNFSEASFRGADARGVTFEHCDLHGSDFAESYLENARFDHAQLDHANFSRAQAKNSHWEMTGLRGADLGHAELREANFSGVDATGAMLREAQLGNSMWQDSLLAEAVLRGAQLQDAQFTRCDFTRAELRDAVASGATFQHCNLQEALLRGANLDNVDLSQSDFAAAYEVEPRYYMQYLATARDGLTQEKAELHVTRGQLENERAALVQERDALARGQEHADEIIKRTGMLYDKLRGAAKVMMVLSLVWIFFAIGLGALIALSLPQMHLRDFQIEEIVLLSIIFVLPPLLFLCGAVNAFFATRAIRHFREGDE